MMKPMQANYSLSPLVSSYSSNLATVRRMTITYAEFDIVYKVNSLWTGEANGSSIITLAPEGVIDVIIVALAVILLFQPLRFLISCKRRIILLRTDPVLYGMYYDWSIDRDLLRKAKISFAVALLAC